MIGDSIIDFVFEFILEFFVNILGYFFYLNGKLILRIFRYDTNKIMSYKFIGIEKSIDTENVSYKFPMKIAIVFWIISSILAYILL
jgi:hypothetical protein